MTVALPDSDLHTPALTPPTLTTRLTHLLNHLQPSPEALVLVSATLIGGGTGGVMVLFHFLIRQLNILALIHLIEPIWMLACLPVLGGVVMGILRWAGKAWLGEEESALASHFQVQAISPFRPLIKMLAALVSLGSGAALGPEGPSVEIGSNIGILLGNAFQVSRQRYRLLVGAGAAAGLAAGFNAPIAGVFLAIELVLGTEFSTPSVSLIVLSSVISAVVGRTFFGVHPAFEFPTYQMLSSWEWVFYLGMGILASGVSLGFTWLIQSTQALFQGEEAVLGAIASPLRPCLGGLIVGFGVWLLPQTFGVGYETLQDILQGEPFSIVMLCGLLLLKPVLTAVSSACGFVGGIFAPAIFLGGCLGALYGQLLTTLLPAGLEIAAPPAYAMVGMAAVLAGTVRAPLTATLLLFEQTQNYLIVLPLMTAVGASVWIVEYVKSNQALQGLNLKQMGVQIEKQDELDVLSQVAIASVMNSNYLALPTTTSLLEAGRLMVQHQAHTALVVDEVGGLVGVLSLSDVRGITLQVERQLASAEVLYQPIQDLCTTDVLFAYPDESVSEAMKRTAARGLYLLPVICREEGRKILGVIERNQMRLVTDLAQTQAILDPHLLEPLPSLEIAPACPDLGLDAAISQEPSPTVA